LSLRDNLSRTEGVIKIVNADNPAQSFDRYITDITFWDGYVIITWKHEENRQ
jgi:hypothetical protein